LEEAVSSVADEQIQVITAGRTDAGVHATGQIVHYDTRSNRLLPLFVSASHDNYCHRIQDTLPIEKYHSQSSCTLSLDHPVMLKLIIRDKTLYAELNSSLTNCESVVLSEST